MSRDTTSEKSDFYDLKNDLFDTGDPEEFLLFTRNLQMTLEDLRTITANAKIKYLCTLLCGETLHQFDTLCDQVGSTTTTHLNRIILGLGTYFFLVNALSRQKRAMRRGTRKPYELKVRCYAALMIDINEYLDALTVSK